METIDGVWYCSNFLGDTFELTMFADGTVMFHALRQRLRRREVGLRLEPRGDFCWEAKDKVRLRQCGKHLSIQHCQKGKWGSEVQAFRESFTATGNYFQGFFKKDGDSQHELFIKRQLNGVSKTTPFDVDSAFMVKSCDSDAVLAFGAEQNRCFESGDIEVVKDIRSKEWDESDCKICMENAADVVLLPCGHGGLCEMCVLKIIEEKKAVSCPFCRTHSQKIVKIDSHISEAIVTDDHMKSISKSSRTPRQAWMQ